VIAHFYNTRNIEFLKLDSRLKNRETLKGSAMETKQMTMKLWIGIGGLALPAVPLSAQDPLVVAPQAYRLSFENDYVQVVRVHYGPKERIVVHDHTPLATAYVYFNDSGPVVFNHIDADYGAVTRPPTQAKAFRIYYGIPEVHEVVNTSELPSDFLRVQFKTQPKNDATFKGKFTAATYPPAENFQKVEVDHEQARITRIAIAPGKRLEVIGNAGEPVLLVALTPVAIQIDSMSASLRKTMMKGDPGANAWIAPGHRKELENRAKTPAEFLRFDFKTPPMSADELAKKRERHPHQ
jgi:hypothetical protein